ncbi:MAG: hypothetical protein ACI4F4_04480 [Lachnospiraceae bacterium]
MSGVEYILLDFFCGVCLWMFVTFVFDNKTDKWLSVWIPVTATVVYFVEGLLIDSIGLVKAGLLELAYMYLLILFYTKGSVWRNYFILCTCFTVQNVLFNLFVITNPKFGNLYAKESSGIREMTLVQGIMAGFFQVISAVIVVLLLRKIFKRIYKGNDTVYKILVIVIIFFALFSALVRGGYIESFGAQGVKATVMGVLNLIFLTAIVLSCGNIFNWYEAWRLRREKKRLEEIVADNYKRLEAEIKKPTLTNGLSGNLVLDSLLMGYSQVMSDNHIVFESMVQQLKSLLTERMDVVVILDDLLTVSFYGSKKEGKDAFVWLSVREIQGKLITVLEFSKEDDLSLQHPRRTLFDREYKQMIRKYNFVRKLVETQDGFIHIQEDGNECRIQLLLP